MRCGFVFAVDLSASFLSWDTLGHTHYRKSADKLAQVTGIIIQPVTNQMEKTKYVKVLMCFLTGCIYNVRYAFYKQKYNLDVTKFPSQRYFHQIYLEFQRLHPVLQMMSKGANVPDNRILHEQTRSNYCGLQFCGSAAA